MNDTWGWGQTTCNSKLYLGPTYDNDTIFPICEWSGANEVI